MTDLERKLFGPIVKGQLVEVGDFGGHPELRFEVSNENGCGGMIRVRTDRLTARRMASMIYKTCEISISWRDPDEMGDISPRKAEEEK